MQIAMPILHASKTWWSAGLEEQTCLFRLHGRQITVIRYRRRRLRRRFCAQLRVRAPRTCPNLEEEEITYEHGHHG